MTVTEQVLRTLLQDCAKGDHGAFERLYKLTSGKLFSLCRRMLPSESLAEEAFQETYVHIWRDAARFNPERALSTTWMAAIARHRCLDLLRRRRPESSLNEEETVLDDQIDDNPNPLELVTRWSDRYALSRCLETLSQQQRKCIDLAFYRGLSHHELSTYLTTPIGTIKSWIRRGLARLKQCLQS